MSNVVVCPECGKKLQLPDALIGKPVRCPGCSTTFTETPAANPCPVCGGTISSGACSDCGYQLNAATPQEPFESPNVCTNKACGTLNPPSERLCQRCSSPLPGALGQVIGGKYRLDRPIATGGFGIVYKAFDTVHKRPVALKEMIAVEPKEFELRRTFFRREAETLRMLQGHKIVPRVYDFIEELMAAYLALELIPGDNLLNVLETPGAKPFPIAKVAEWGARICDVLAAMHKSDPPLIHRDLKPENIMLLPDGDTIRLIDFGTARGLGKLGRERGVARTKVYTEGYAPPEQVVGKAEPRSDLFALAGTLYQLATGTAPEGIFTGRDLWKELVGHSERDRWFYELLAINLSEDPHERYPSAIDFQNDLRAGAVTREVLCPGCRSKTTAREPYCRSCARPLTEAGPGCPKCEAPNRLGCRFCIACGQRL